MAFAVPVIFFVVFFGDIQPAIATAGAVQYAPSDAWVSSLTWMKGNTSDPFDNPDFYYALPEQPPPGEKYKYPESAYGVLAWWDYGYWITRIAQRIPNANPSQDPAALTTVASFFISQNETSANEIAQKLHSAYIIIDDQTAYIDPTTGSGKFWAVATWAGRQPSEYFDFYLIPQENNTWVLRPFFYPEYYRSLVVRLYNFDGQAVTPESVWVISYEERTDNAGNVYKVITGAENKGTYEEAQAYVSSQTSGNYRIISMNPMLSPTPLEAVEHYKLVHSSDNLTLPDGRSVPQVKIFEYLD
jgi:dolichyl-diphosphooligosaccharide--protein glycosyltransferase